MPTWNARTDLLKSVINCELIKGIDGDRIVMSGPINEHFHERTKALLAMASARVNVDLGGVEYINSQGVRCWLTFIRELSDDRRVVLDRCSSDFINQVNVIPDFSMGSEIKSFFIDLFCEECQIETTHLFTTAEGFAAVHHTCQDQRCEQCGNVLQIETDVDLYLRFLNQEARASQRAV